MLSIGFYLKKIYVIFPCKYHTKLTDYSQCTKGPTQFGLSFTSNKPISIQKKTIDFLQCKSQALFVEMSHLRFGDVQKCQSGMYLVYASCIPVIYQVFVIHPPFPGIQLVYSSHFQYTRHILPFTDRSVNVPSVFRFETQCRKG